MFSEVTLKGIFIESQCCGFLSSMLALWNVCSSNNFSNPNKQLAHLIESDFGNTT